MKVVVVESPAKAKTINKYLGRDYEVIASFGHIRDLPPKDGSVDPEQDFRMVWELADRGASRVSEIAKAVKGADKLILATDPDREGEAISWHVLEALTARKALKGIPVERVTFNAITKASVEQAMRKPREIDQALVDAYLARRALDYLVGFNLSPVLWRKLPGARSAGRVQSVALRLVVEREMEIERFKPREYWTLIATLTTADGATFEARPRGRRRQAHPAPRRRHGRRGGRLQARPRARDLPGGERRGQARQAPPAAALHHLDPSAGGLAQARHGAGPAPCGSPSAFTRASTSAARRSASSPTCGPTASTWRRRRSRTPAGSSARSSATATCRTCRASTASRPRTPRRPTRRCVPPTWAACPRRWRATWSPSRPGSTS